MGPDGTHYRLIEGEPLGIRHGETRLTLEDSAPVHVKRTSAVPTVPEPA